MDLRTTITKVLLGEEIVTEERTTVVGKPIARKLGKSGKGLYSAPEREISTEHEHKGNKYTVTTQIDGGGDHYHNIKDHSTGEEHNSVPYRYSVGDGKASPLHKKLIQHHIDAVKPERLERMGAVNF